jgi:hypothetical protein
MRFHRGIAVPADSATDSIAAIRSLGLVPRASWWSMVADNLKPRLDELWRLPVITLAATRPVGQTPPWVCACADEAGAAYYACRHNRSTKNDKPLLITFDADAADVIVDGRDFLYTLFQMGDPKRARPVAERLFGSAILRYLDRAWSSEDQEQRVAICDLAVQDDAVVKAHAASEAIIEGRYGTRFRNAFMVRLSVPSERIVDVRAIEIDVCVPDAEISLDSIRSG